MTELRDDVKEKLVLSLDVGDLSEALKMVELVGDYFGYAKIGSELYAQNGAEAVLKMRELGIKVFLDLKLHDIPNTVERACEVHAARGVSMITIHASGGKEMMLAAKDGLAKGAAAGGFETPILLAVTVLTSLPSDDAAFKERLLRADEVGCDIVCSAHELGIKNSIAPNVRALTPGIRLAGQDTQDQTRVATPESAIKDGSSWLVIGRAVTAASDPLAAAKEVYSQTKSALNREN